MITVEIDDVFWSSRGKTSIFFYYLLCLRGDACPKPPAANQPSFHPTSCLVYLLRGASKCGIYQLYDSKSGNWFPAYCDLKSEPGTAWTLVMSWSVGYRRLSPFSKFPFKYNSPVNENAQNWNLYGISLARMRSLQAHSTHWRATCSYPTHGIDFKDYLSRNFKDFNIVDFLGDRQCKKVEYINIQGHVGTHLTVPFWQRLNSYTLHTDGTYTHCQFKTTKTGAISSEDNFGHYGSITLSFAAHIPTSPLLGGGLELIHVICSETQQPYKESQNWNAALKRDLWKTLIKRWLRYNIV